MIAVGENYERDQKKPILPLPRSVNKPAGRAKAGSYQFAIPTQS